MVLLAERDSDLETPLPASAGPRSDSSEPAGGNRQSAEKWHVLIATWLGGVFDGMDSSIFAMVLYPALSDLLGTKSHAIVGMYGSYIVALFTLGWALGAMMFGILADYIGRARTLALTILLYAMCTGLCATAHSWWELGIYRFLVGAGIGGELGIGAVYLSEAWANKSRIKAVSFMSTSLGFGYMATASLNWLLGGYGWRALFTAGIIPAILTFYIRTKLKESHQFVESKNQRNAASRIQPESADAVAGTAGGTGPIRWLQAKTRTFTVWQLFTEENANKTVIVGLLASVAIICWWAVVAWVPAWINQLTGTLAIHERSCAMFAKDVGMILSGVIGGLMVAKLGYRKSMVISMLGSFFTAVGMYITVHAYSLSLLGWTAALGFFANVPFVILWIYIPELYRAEIRSTAFGVSYNSGRFAAALAVLGSGAMIHALDGSYAIAGSSVAVLYLLGAVVAFKMPVPKGDLR